MQRATPHLGRTLYQSSLNPICICLASRLRAAFPKLEGIAAVAISVRALFSVTADAFMTLLKSPVPPVPRAEEVGIVEHVEDLEAHLQLHPTRGLHRLVEREVGLEQTRTAALAAFQTADRAELEARQRHGRGIDDLFGVIAVVGPTVGTGGVGPLVVGVAGPGRAAVETRHAAGVDVDRLAQRPA